MPLPPFRVREELESSTQIALSTTFQRFAFGVFSDPVSAGCFVSSTAGTTAVVIAVREGVTPRTPVRGRRRPWPRPRPDVWAAS